MVGIVTTRHLLTHPRTIIHEFGTRCYLRCIWRTLAEDRAVTFLECVATMSSPTSKRADWKAARAGGRPQCSTCSALVPTAEDFVGDLISPIA